MRTAAQSSEYCVCVRPFGRHLCMHHCFDLSCIALAIVSMAITTSYDTRLLRTRMDNQPFFPYRLSWQCVPYAPRLAIQAGVIHHDFIRPKGYMYSIYTVEDKENGFDQ